MMNSWLNRTSQYPMLSWRAWKITVARRWFISWETKSNRFNLKLGGIQVESTKTQPVKTTADLLLSEGNISVQTEGVMYVKFPAHRDGNWGLSVQHEQGVSWCWTGGASSQWTAMAKRPPGPGGQQRAAASCHPLVGQAAPLHAPLPVARAWIMSHVHVICGRRKNVFSKDTVGPCNLPVFSMGEDPC